MPYTFDKHGNPAVVFIFIKAKQTGITLPIFQCLAQCQGVRAELHLASQSTEEEFRTAVKEACLEGNQHEMACNDSTCHECSQKFLIASYHRGTLKQSGSGHFSPIAAYEPITDQVLILDVARFKYGPHWTPLSLLFEAMKPCDPDTNQSRGYLLLSLHEHSNCCPQQELLPQSMLFRSKMRQCPIRQRYRRFLSSKSSPEGKEVAVTFEEVVQFWSRDGTSWDYIWEVIEPQLLPVNVEEKVFVEDLLALLRSLLSAYLSSDATSFDFRSWTELQQQNQQPLQESNVSCGYGKMRTIPIQPIDAVFVTYIASLPLKEERRRVVYTMIDKQNIQNYNDVVLEQLLSEVELVRLAIDYSHVFENSMKDCAIGLQRGL